MMGGKRDEQRNVRLAQGADGQETSNAFSGLRCKLVIVSAAILPCFQCAFPTVVEQGVELTADEVVKRGQGCVQSSVPAEGNEMPGPAQNWQRSHMLQNLGNEGWVRCHLLKEGCSQRLELDNILQSN